MVQWAQLEWTCFSVCVMTLFSGSCSHYKICRTPCFTLVCLLSSVTSPGHNTLRFAYDVPITSLVQALPISLLENISPTAQPILDPPCHYASPHHHSQSFEMASLYDLKLNVSPKHTPTGIYIST
ncbi:hypothetical protein BD769DRAFT_307562 [Suillus cothurnatus]|nr:hypothetical protein BD769DRAFT_307562 [Suillus cothurnatus]